VEALLSTVRIELGCFFARSNATGLVYSEQAELNGTLVIKLDPNFVDSIVNGHTNYTQLLIGFGNVTGSFSTVQFSSNVPTSSDNGCNYFTTSQTINSLSLLFVTCSPSDLPSDSPLTPTDEAILGSGGLDAGASAGVAIAVIAVVAIAAVVVIVKVPAARKIFQPFKRRRVTAPAQTSVELESAEAPASSWQTTNKAELTIKNT